MTTPPSPDPISQPLPAGIRAALEKGEWIEAIKLLRTSGGIGLKEAKQIVDRQRSIAAPVKAPHLDRHRAPGEVPRVPGVVWLVLVVGLAVLALLGRLLGGGPG